MKIQTLKISAVCLFAIVLSLTLTGLAQGHQHGGGGQQGKGQQGMGMGQGQQKDMQTIHAMFDEHGKITRSIKKIPNGIEAITESEDAAVRAKIVEHTWAMKARLEKHQPIRMWDPLFAELFKQADKIKLEVVNTAKGVKVIETSTDAYVVKLIQAHAEGVSEFVKEGTPSMHKSHPLPGEAPKSDVSFIGKGDGITTCPVTGEPVNKDIKWGFYGRTVYFCCESCLDAVKLAPERYLKP